MNVKQVLLTIAVAALMFVAHTAYAQQVSTGVKTYDVKKLTGATDTTPGTLADAKSIAVTGAWTNAQLLVLKAALRATTDSIGENSVLEEAYLEGMRVSGAVSTGFRGMFENCTALKLVRMPSTRMLGAADLTGTFAGCTSLATVENFEQVNTVASLRNTFKGCAGLTAVELRVASDAGVDCTSMFEGCTSLKSSINLSIIAAATGITRAFKDCASLGSVSLPKGGADVEGGISFESTFEGCTELTQVDNLYLFANVSTFRRAFTGCANLTAATLCPTGTTADEDGISFEQAFEGCGKLSTVTNFEAFERIANLQRTFAGCASLTAVRFGILRSASADPSAVTFAETFSGASSNCLIYLPVTSPAAPIAWQKAGYPNIVLAATGKVTGRASVNASLPMDAALLSKGMLSAADTLVVAGAWTNDGLNMLYNAITISLPTGGRGSEVIKCADLSAMTLSEDIPEGMSSLFFQFTALESVTLPATETDREVDFRATFVHCTSLKSVVNLDKFTRVSSFYETFYGCPSLQSVMLPAGSKTEGTDFFMTFYECTSLASVTNLDKFDNVTSMREMFARCSSLASVALPVGVSVLNDDIRLEGTFSGCTSLRSVTNLDKYSNIDSFVRTFMNCESLQSVTLPQGSTAPSVLFNDAFSGCTSLTTIGNLDKFTNIEGLQETFMDCTLLRKITFSPSWNTYPDEISFSGAFYGCTSLTEIENLDRFTRVGDFSGAFFGCKSLETVTLPAGGYKGEYGVDFAEAFSGCTKLTTVVNLEKFTNIGDFTQTFLHCASLPSVTLCPSGSPVEELLFTQAFRGCTSLTSVANLDKFACAAYDFTRAFSGCTQLREVTLPDGALCEYVLFGGAFSGCSSLTSVRLCQLPDEDYLLQSAFDDANPNCLKYLFPGWDVPSEWINAGYRNFICFENDVNPFTVDDIILEEGHPFRCPLAFTLTPGYMIEYVRDFGTEDTGSGTSLKGWETLCLPFTPTEILGMNATGAVVSLVPFRPDGTYEGQDKPGVAPFRLRSLGAESYTVAERIVPHVPYLIAFPNNEAYEPKFNVTGEVFFRAEAKDNGEPIVIPVTEDLSSVCVAYTLQGNHAVVPASQEVYVINEEGTAFVANGGDALPFRPYASANAPDAAPARFEIGTEDTIPSSIEEAILTGRDAAEGSRSFLDAEGNLRSGSIRLYASGPGSLTVEARGEAFADGPCDVVLYAADGRAVRVVSLHEGMNRVDGLAGGVYILARGKVGIR